MSDNFFAQLQAMSTMNEDTTVLKARADLRRIVDLFKARDDYWDTIDTLAYIRKLDIQTIIDCEGFMVNKDDVFISQIPEDLQHDSLGFCKGNYLVFEGRFVYPVKDVKGNVMGFCGYDMHSDIKYLDSTNYGYKAKQYSMWGMERLPEYYDSKDPVFFVEGIVCALYLRQCGMNSLATLGSSFSPYCTEIVKRFGTRAIIINDSDEAGSKCRSIMSRRCKQARCIQSKIAKDVDDSRLVDPTFADELRKLSNPFYVSRLFE